MTQSPFPTKFVADVREAIAAAAASQTVTLTVGGTVILTEKYTPADGKITVRGLRQVLEAAIYGRLATGTQATASAQVTLAIGSDSDTATLYASRLRDPHHNGQNSVMAAGDLVAVTDQTTGNFISGSALITAISSGSVVTTALTPTGHTDGENLGDNVRLWIERTTCPEKAVAVRFLNRYDVPQTMMTVRPLTVKAGFTDKTALINGQRVRFSVEQQDEYTLQSGQIHSAEEYASWADLATSRKAEVWLFGQWMPIVVTKANVTATRQPLNMKPAEITFRMADPRQGL